jgi:hypothetical protein
METAGANKLYSDLTNFLAVYETYQSNDYDIFDVQYTVQVSLFIEKFENDA